jgi:hypothetical protein
MKYAESALGDFAKINTTCGEGAHVNYKSCSGFKESGGSGQNMCCPWPVGDFSKTRASMYQCLQQMWDEVSTTNCEIELRNSPYNNYRDPSLFIKQDIGGQ